MTYAELRPGDVYVTLWDEIYVLVRQKPGHRVWLSLEDGKLQVTKIIKDHPNMRATIPEEQLLWVAPRRRRGREG